MWLMFALLSFIHSSRVGSVEGSSELSYRGIKSKASRNALADFIESPTPIGNFPKCNAE